MENRSSTANNHQAGLDQSTWWDALWVTAFQNAQTQTFGIATSLCLAICYLSGLIIWWIFLNGGTIQFTLHDWVEAGHRYAFLQNALSNGQLPLHMPGDWALRGVTDRFLSVVDTNISPQILLLGFLPLGKFIVLNTSLLYSIGFAGLLLLHKRCRFSILVTLYLFLLLFFNGHIVSHIGVGHTHWAAYFLSPFILISVLEFHDNQPGWLWIGLTSFLLFFIFLQGAFHLFVILFLFFFLTALQYIDKMVPAFKMLLASVLLSMVRILPALIDFNKFDTDFFTGFPSSHHVLIGLTTLGLPQEGIVYDNLPLNPLGWWEFDYFIGGIGLAFALSFLLIRDQITRRSDSRIQYIMGVFLVLSVGITYSFIDKLGIPLLSTQRVSSRLFVIPFVLSLGLSAIKIQTWLDRRDTNLPIMLVLIGSLCLLANDLLQHLLLWRVDHISDFFTPADVNLAANIVVDRFDPIYETLLMIGGMLSLASLLFITWKVLQTLRAKRGSF